jgi:hypothetical protein
MPRYRVQGLLEWTEEHSEYVDVVVDATDEEEAREMAAQDEWGVTLGNDLLHGFSSFSDDTVVEEVEEDEEDS